MPPAAFLTENGRPADSRVAKTVDQYGQIRGRSLGQFRECFEMMELKSFATDLTSLYKHYC